MSLRHNLLDGRLTVAGLISEITNPRIVTMLKTAGLDSVIVDMEHGSYDWSETSAMIAVGAAAGFDIVVRVPEIRKEPIQKVLDAGAHGILVPMVDDAGQAREAVRLAKFPEQGERGVALRRAHSDFRVLADPAAYMAQANDDVAVMVQIETVTAVRNADEIACVPGVDVLFVGPWDLSVSARRPGQTWTPQAREAYAHVRAVASKHGKAAGIHVVDAKQAAELACEGFGYVSFTSDVSALMDSITDGAAQVRARVETAGVDG